MVYHAHNWQILCIRSWLPSLVWVLFTSSMRWSMGIHELNSVVLRDILSTRYLKWAYLLPREVRSWLCSGRQWYAWAYLNLFWDINNLWNSLIINFSLHCCISHVLWLLLNTYFQHRALLANHKRLFADC